MFRSNAQDALRRRIVERNLDELADLVSEGMSVQAAARSMGLSQQRDSQMRAEIRARLGVEAKDEA